jgi:hypothetical protein
MDPDVQQRIVVITNAHAQVDAMLKGTDWKGKAKADMLAALKFNLPSGSDRWDATSTAKYTALPMWGESAPETITGTTKKLVSTIPLLRMTARIDVQVDGSVSGLRGKFKLRSVDLYNTNTGGQVVPAAGNYSDDPSANPRIVTAGKPTIPTELQPKGARHVGPIQYTDFTNPGTVDAAMIGTIYTFETNNAAVGTEPNNPDATCLVIGGVYGTDTQPTYYRVDLMDNGSPNKRLDVLRNWRYLVNIVEVLGPGKPTVDEAYKSKSINMDSNTVAFNDSNMTNIIYNGENYISTDKASMTLYKNGYGKASVDGANVMQVTTDFPNGWELDKIVNEDGTAQNWILGMNPNSGAANAKTSTYITVSQNDTGAARTALMTLTAGDKLSTTIKITQGSAPMPLAITPKDATGKEITSMVFATAAGTQPPSQTLTINWTPIDRSVDVKGAMTTGATTDFPAGSGQPAGAETIIAGSGTKTYTIQPPAITAAEIASNPFIEKSTTFDFTATDGVSTTKKTVVISQAVYNVIADNAAYYVVNGGNYSFKVRSNARWVIKSVINKPDQSYKDYAKQSLLANTSTDNLAPGTTGGPNPAAAGGGDDIKFTTTGQTGMWGTIDVVFSSPDTPAKFADKTVTLVMVAPEIKIVGCSYAGNNDNAALYSPTTKAQRKAGDPADMYTNATNFGVQERSTVKCLPINIVDGGTANSKSDNSNYDVTVDHMAQAMTNNPDVICIAGNATINDDVALYIKRQMLDKGKTVFIGIQEQESLMRVLRACFGATWMNGSGLAWDTGSGKYQDVTPGTYQIDPNGNHPTIIGPFGDLRGKNWGSQWNGVYGVYDIPDDTFVRYSSTKNTTGPVSPGLQGDVNRQYTAFFAKPFRLMWICDDGFFRNDNPTRTDVSPFYIDPTTKKPATKQYGRDSKVDIYNSAMFANMLAWVVARYPKQ